MPKKAVMPSAPLAESYAYCVKCKDKKTMKDTQTITNGNRARQVGICTTCGTKMSKFIKA